MRYKILVCDDDEDILEMIKETLTKHEMSVVTATEGKSCIEKIKETAPDLIILDFALPNMSGMDVCKILQQDKSLSHIPIIFITGKDKKSADVVKGLNIGASDYILKPFNPDVLLAKINICLSAVADRKKAEEELRESEEIFSQFMNYSPIYVFFKDENIKAIRLSKNYAEMLGRPISELLGKNMNDLFPSDLAKSMVADDKRILKEGKKVEVEEELNGRFYSTIKFPIYREGKPTYLAGFTIDITERKKLEEEKEKIQNQLLQSRKMESIGTLAGGIAHDFNNLLTPIKGYAELAMTSIDKKNPIYDDLNEIRSIADKAADLARQLLFFSRKQPIRLITLNSNKIIENMSKMLKRIIGEDIEIKKDLQPDIWNINADESRLEQVIMNLTVNAHNAMPNGGILTVKTENVVLNEEHSKDIPSSYPGRFVKLSIQDNGKGMSNEVIQRIFEPFFTTKGVGKGTGLGLSVVYGIVKQHNGWINVYSEHDKGTIFKIYLPASLEKKEFITPKKVEYRNVTGHGERILVVEDDKGIRDFVNKALLMNGYVVFLAENAKEAIEIYKKENVHLVISDVVLPDKTGIELVNQLFIDNPKLKVIFSSGYLDDKSQWEMIQEKGFKFLQKPYELKELLGAIKEVLDKK